MYQKPASATVGCIQLTSSISIYHFSLKLQKQSSDLSKSVASLGFTRVGVTRGCNWGITPIFLKNGDLFKVITAVCQLCSVTPIYFLLKNWRTFFFCSSLSLIDFTRVSSSWRASTCTFFYLSDLVCPLFFVNMPTKNFFPFGRHPPEGCHPGRSP